MPQKLANQPALPPSNPHTGESGMTYRQWLAGINMAALLSNPMFAGQPTVALTKEFGSNWVAVVALA